MAHSTLIGKTLIAMRQLLPNLSSFLGTIYLLDKEEKLKIHIDWLRFNQVN